MTTRYSHGVKHVVGPAARLLAVVAVLLLPGIASAQVLFADLNGDGIHDRVDAGVRPTEIIVRLSAGHHRQHRLHTDSPIIRLTAVDFNRDGNIDLVATTVKPGRVMPASLTVWINNGHGRFARHKAAVPARAPFEVGGASASRAPHGLEADENADDQASRPLLVAATFVGPHEFSYVRRLRADRTIEPRFEGRSRIPRGPPAGQLF